MIALLCMKLKIINILAFGLIRNLPLNHTLTMLQTKLTLVSLSSFAHGKVIVTGQTERITHRNTDWNDMGGKVAQALVDWWYKTGKGQTDITYQLYYTKAQILTHRLIY